MTEQAAAEAARLSPAMRASLLGRYIAGIKERVYRHMSNPEGVDPGIAVEVRVRLNDDGTLVRVAEVADSSGNAAYDTQAVRAVIREAESGFDLPDDPELRSEFDDLLLVIAPKN